MKPSMQSIAAAFKSYLAKNPLAKMLKTDKTLNVSEEGVLGVNMADTAEDGSILAVSASTVHEIVGDVESL